MIGYKNFQSRVIYNSNLLVTALFLLAGFGMYFSTVVPNAYTLVLPWSLALSAMVYLVFNDNETNADFFSIPTIDTRTILIPYLMILSISSVLYNSFGYERTVLIHGLTFLLYALTFVSIASDKYKLSVFTLVLTSLYHRATMYFSSPQYLGVDIFGHIGEAVTSIASTGELSVIQGSKSYYSPFFHISGAVGELLYNLPEQTSMFLVYVLPFVVVVTLFPIVVTKILSSWRIGVLAALIFSTSDHILKWSVSPQTTSLGLVYYVVGFSSLVLYIYKKDQIYFLLYGLFLTAIIFTHQVSTFIFGATTMTFLTAEWLFNDKKQSLIRMSLLTLVVVTLNFVTTRIRGVGTESFLDYMVRNVIESAANAGATTRSTFELPADPAISAIGSSGLTIEQVVGMGLLYFFGILGVLYYLKKKNKFVLPFAVTVLVLSLFTFGGSAVNMDDLQPIRWFAFLYFPLSILGVMGLTALGRAVSSRIASENSSGRGLLTRENLQFVLVGVLLFATVVPMGINYVGAYDDPVLDSAPKAERWAVTDAEDEMYEFTGEHADGTAVVGDFRSYRYVWTYNKSISREDSFRTYSREYEEPSTLVPDHTALLIDREYIHGPHPESVLNYQGTQHRIFGPIPLGAADDELSTVYSNGDDTVKYSE